MNRKWLYALVGGAAVAATVLVLLVFVFGVFQRSPDASTGAALGAAAPGSQTASGSSQPLAAATGASTASSGVPSEGIKVHGHWTIEVRNPDGTLADRSEFDNALSSGAAADLAKFLGRVNTVGQWIIIVNSSDPPCLYSTSTPAQCNVSETISSPTATNIFKTLTVTVPASGPDAGKLVLSGNLTAQRSGSISLVFTTVWLCAPTNTPSSNCESGTTHFITQANLSTPVNVLNGQQVLTTVVLSFS